MEKKGVCDNHVWKAQTDSGAFFQQFHAAAVGERVAMNSPIQGSAADIMK